MNEIELQYKNSESQNIEKEAYGLAPIYVEPIAVTAMEQKKGSENVKIVKSKGGLKKLKTFFIVFIITTLYITSIRFYIELKLAETPFYKGWLYDFVDQRKPKISQKENMPLPLNNDLDSLENNETALVQKETEPDEVIQSDSLYYIIISAFKDLQNAEEAKTTLLNQGLDAELVQLAGSSLIRMSAATFTNRKAAESELPKFKSGKYPDAWVMAKIKTKNN